MHYWVFKIMHKQRILSHLFFIDTYLLSNHYFFCEFFYQLHCWNGYPGHLEMSTPAGAESAGPAAL